VFTWWYLILLNNSYFVVFISFYPVITTSGIRQICLLKIFFNERYLGIISWLLSHPSWWFIFLIGRRHNNLYIIGIHYKILVGVCSPFIINLHLYVVLHLFNFFFFIIESDKFIFLYFIKIFRCHIFEFPRLWNWMRGFCCSMSSWYLSVWRFISTYFNWWILFRLFFIFYCKGRLTLLMHICLWLSLKHRCWSWRYFIFLTCLYNSMIFFIINH